MLFNSLVFLFFSVIFFLLWPLVKKHITLCWISIVAASFVFYGWWDWRYCFLLILSGMIDFVAAILIERHRRYGKMLLFVSLACNLGVLFLFKYSLFVTKNIDLLLGYLGGHVQLTPLMPAEILILPVGISFYTFQSMSYTIDVYRRECKAVYNVFHFFAFLSMLPQLVAGPIIRASDLLPQLKKTPQSTEADRWDGTVLIIYGYFKKCVVADNLAPYVNNVFANPSFSNDSLVWWSAVTGFAFQIYCDFSGYSDIARGLAKWMGYDFMVNFNRPYMATSLREVWSRWHISLSTWFRDYIYLPLLRGKRENWRTDCSMWATMIISGIWHGAAWTFVAWGMLHALGLTLERWVKRSFKTKNKSGKIATHCLGWLFAMTVVWCGWVFFRASSLPQAFKILGVMFSFKMHSFYVLKNILPYVTAVLVLDMVGAKWAQFHAAHPLPLRRAIEITAMAVLAAAAVFFRGPGTEFIYFQF